VLFSSIEVVIINTKIIIKNTYIEAKLYKSLVSIIANNLLPNSS
jgi:hypothetical protein